jgi:hypothetical protein
VKQINYNFNIQKLIKALVNDLVDIEDGHWEMALQTENVTVYLPAFVDGMRTGTLPSHVTRLLGVQLIRRDFPSEITVPVKDGIVLEILNGIDSNNNRPIESGTSIGENSGDLREIPASPPTRSKSLKRGRHSNR